MTTLLITGTNKGVGLELTKIYAARGDTVYAACRNPAEADELKAIEGDVNVIEAVVGDSASVTAMAAALDGVAIDLSLIHI